MQCPYCAEEIKDAAVICRFCGAARTQGQWRPPGATGHERSASGRTTLRLAGVLFIASAGFELISLGSAVPLFGAVRTGLVAGAWHVLWGGVFVMLGIALLRPTPRGYRIVMAGTGLYLAAKLLYLLDASARAAELDQALHGLGATLPISTGSIDTLVVVTTLTLMACWVGFAAYVHWRRAYFSGET